MNNLNDVDKIVCDSFGLWINALFGSISAYNPKLSFLEHKVAFFDLLRKLLDEGKIYFEDPNSQFGSQNVWKVDTQTIIQYLSERWPTNATDENDSDLNIYFYEIPSILWIGDDGVICSS